MFMFLNARYLFTFLVRFIVFVAVEHYIWNAVHCVLFFVFIFHYCIESTLLAFSTKSGRMFYDKLYLSRFHAPTFLLISLLMSKLGQKYNK